MTPNFAVPQKIKLETIELEAIHIASPCRADWEQMRGDDRVRHCKACAKNVYNLSTMTREQAKRLISEKEGDLCVQLHRRADGTVITSDCTVGVSIHKKSRRVVPRLVATIFAALLGVLGVKAVRAAPNCDAPNASTAGAASTKGAPQMLMGEMLPLRGEAVLSGRPTPLLGRMAPVKPKKPAKAVKMAGKNHGKYSARISKRRASNALQHRRHR
ncbi:hypothetical protein [Abditibacterium utsteinense]|uniref:hypothetical protein n=1 Tax=Abditibacterium utsteinense TaxID=1960156 RepID=UPI000F48042C|nr:hypothetical protein [Abditibacterium utsteinense]